MTEIRRFLIGDFDEVFRIETNSFKKPWTKGVLEGDVKNRVSRYYVAVVDGKIAAFCGFYEIADEADISKIATAKEFRRQGVAKALLAYIIDELKKSKVLTITLEVNKNNAAAIALYLSFGFLQNGVRPKYYDGVDDALLFKLDLR